ncbi:hypothetical protein [Nocardioides daphniae]|uniref:Fibronectin type III domain-containing protein n=1 Tax=Nocardioides daphniae TaxID=402297 RepID=A0A4P7UEF7_9ACTN|nr:hypothetical protein [Nocardioides daphniae]QCC77795.1 hypothetical protein E2C04_12475 [Nocardioides daphniae]GGD28298.1 hypothetical protein GCM10007231_29780 [Nocardioides daphniae]
MNSLKKAALGAGVTLMAAGGSLFAVPAAHAAPAPVGSVVANRTEPGVCTVRWTYGPTDVFFDLKETDLYTGEVRNAVYAGTVRRAVFTFRNGTHRFRYAVRVSKGGEVSTWKSDICEKA